ncbi:hypothetical protein C5Y97_21630 [Blastopirellula marina]|uniref:Uncharacterized protein n=1 Tax=Blastopirellula marina TaxID=124 RepID=A0A2S8FDH1_9BACT|nr:hypothetical protein C5Y98_21620 [Blastopirellula marina]PTL42588.1 hypothetical protein C5Y97_21630 [Blastopirellula marina]
MVRTTKLRGKRQVAVAKARTRRLSESMPSNYPPPNMIATGTHQFSLKSFTILLKKANPDQTTQTSCDANSR